MQTSLLLLEANSISRRWANEIVGHNMIRATSAVMSSRPSSPLRSQIPRRNVSFHIGRYFGIYRNNHGRSNIHFQRQPWSDGHSVNENGISPAASSPAPVTRQVTCHCRPIRFLSSASSSSSPSSSSSTSNDNDNDNDNDSDQGIRLSPTQTTLALSVHFQHPALGMKDFEILSRASAFLVNVDPLSPDESRVGTATAQTNRHREGGAEDDPNNTSPSTNTNYPHLTRNQTLRQKLLHRQNYAYEPAGGPRRFPHQLNWLEFCPDVFRPKVHVVASSHVLSPWLWPKYYGQEWLKLLKDEGGGEGFVRYSLEVWGKAASVTERDGNDGGGWIGHDGKLEGMYKPLAKFALNPYPIHHPQGMDVAVIHLKQEDTALKHLTSLGIHPLNLPTMHEFQSSTDPVFHPDERVLFQGYEVYEANMADEPELPSSATATTTTTNRQKQQKQSSSEEDERTFHPYSSLGTIAMASPDRFLAKTKGGPLPEGLCGGPVIQLTDPKTGENLSLTTTAATEKIKITKPLNLRGVVEGIVPINHEDSRMAGLASFLPSYRIREFVDFAERVMLQQIVPEELFEKVVAMKGQEAVKNTVYRGGVGNELREEGKYDVDAHDDGGGRQEKRNGLENEIEDDDDQTSPKHPFVEGFGESEHTPELDREYQEILASLSQRHSPQEVDAILATVEAERKEVIEIMEREGGDLDDVIARVRKQTYERKEKILEELQKEIEQGMWGQRGSVQEGEIVSSRDHDNKK